MPDITSEDANLQALTEAISVWTEHVLSRKDFDKCTPAPQRRPKEDIPALDAIFQGYCSRRSGTITPDTWAGVTRIVKTLMSTEYFVAQWELRKEEFPQDFRDFMQSPRVS